MVIEVFFMKNADDIVDGILIDRKTRIAGVAIVFLDILQTVFVDIDSGWIGKDVRSVEQSDDALIVLVKRRGKTERPDRDYRVMVGDELAVLLKE